MGLFNYKAKRQLKKSKEPSAVLHKKKSGDKLHFVIQEHHARRLHYDLRLELNGVLKSWAVPKGPTLDPSQKRLAIMVEDHPYDYQYFEGVIPSGYGAGTVEIWDKGFYDVNGLSPKESEKLLKEGLKKGEIHFSLDGEKLHGEFVMIKLKNSKKENEWLLFKKKDDFVSKEEVVKKKPLKKGRKSPMPHHVKPMLATLVDEPFNDEKWLFEVKWDGWRALSEVKGSRVELYSRTFKSFNESFPLIVESLSNLKVNAVFDGEIVALDTDGKPNFQKLQNYKTSKSLPLYYYIFDLLYLEGIDLRSTPLIERKRLLKQLLQSKNEPSLRFCDHIETLGIDFFKAASDQGIEGIVGKLKTSVYESATRSKNWLKVKKHQTQEALICGFTTPKGSRKGIGALILGIYKKGELTFIGHVGGGFSDFQLLEMKKMLLPLKVNKALFKVVPKTNSKVTWVKPQLICEVSFSEWTNEGSLRHPIFVGLREDKKRKEIKEEKPKKTKAVLQKVVLTNENKLYWPKEKITKGDLIHYYQAVAPTILPYLLDRPESLKRFPNGIEGESFFQKNLASYPEWIQTVKIPHREKLVNYLLIQNEETLSFTANLGCIEIHPFFSKIHSLQYPDFMAFDLDPHGASFLDVIEIARALHKLAEELEIPTYCKTSGATGLHIYVPLGARYTYEETKLFAQLIARKLHERTLSISTLERNTKKRKGKVYIDYLQNNFGQTLAAPYSVRAYPHAPVSTPLKWSEVKKGLNPSNFTMRNTSKRLEKIGDIFLPVLGQGIRIEKILPYLENDF